MTVLLLVYARIVRDRDEAGAVPALFVLTMSFDLIVLCTVMASR